MDLKTTYLGLDLPHPLMPGASPLVDDMEMVLRLEEAGAAAIVMHSLFEEEVTREDITMFHDIHEYEAAHPEAGSYFQEPVALASGPQLYLERVARIRDRVGVPLIASLNGVTARGWLEYAGLIEQAGADALELNTYYLATDPTESAEDVEQRTLQIVRTVKEAVAIPVAVKLSPFFSSMANFAHRLDELGADGLVLFNRFYQPDLDIDELEVVPSLHFSDSSELLLRLRWLAILSGQVEASLAVTGGVHTAVDAIKAVMTGAHAVQMVSALLQRRSPEYLRTVLEEMTIWLEEHEYDSLSQARGSMSLTRIADPSAYERANYMRILNSWRV